MTSGQIFIISNPIYSQYGLNVYMIGSSSDPHQTIDILSSAFTQPFEIHFISSKSPDMDHLLVKVYDELKYNRIKPNKQLFMLPNLQMVQQMIVDFIVNNLLPNQEKAINTNNILGVKAVNKIKISPSKSDNNNDQFIDDDEPILKPITKKIKNTNKNNLDENIVDSDIEDINIFRDLLTHTESIKKVKTIKKIK
jgi:hypothetical protein